MAYFIFGPTIKEIRQQSDLSQTELAEGICTQALVSRIENGLTIPNAILLKDLCRKLNVSVDFVLSGDTFLSNDLLTTH